MTCVLMFNNQGSYKVLEVLEFDFLKFKSLKTAIFFKRYLKST